ncbi:MAG: FdhD protein [Parvicellaceae bacterium]
MDSSKYEGIKFQLDQVNRVDDSLTVEEALQININAGPFTVIMRTPGDELDMVRGLLYSEDLYKGETPIELKSVKRNELEHITEVNVEINESDLGSGYSDNRSMLSVSSCGICGKRELGDLSVEGSSLKVSQMFDPLLLDAMYSVMESKQTTFKKTGGSHGAAAFTIAGEFLTLKEDIGRHNAVDKVIGSLLNNRQLKNAKCLLVSGRISYEIVTKAFMAKIPVLVAVSAPSSLAVDYAKEFGMTLFAFTRKGKTTCYSHPERVLKTNSSKHVA